MLGDEGRSKLAFTMTVMQRISVRYRATER
jgi:hypothetical protein